MSSVDVGRKVLDAGFPAIPNSVPAARRSVSALAGRCGAGEGDLERIALAISEAVTNAIVHGYGGLGQGSVRLTAAEADGVLTILVADDGCGMGRAPASMGLGLGLGLIGRSCDWVAISARSSGGTLVEMSFQLAPSSGVAEGSEGGRQLAEGDRQGEWRAAAKSAA